MGFEIRDGILKKYMAEPGVTEVIIPDGVTTIGIYAFEGCTSLTAVTIPESVREIQPGAFYGCSRLRSAVIPEGIAGIPDRAFSLCGKLRSVTIPDSVTEIGAAAFLHCSGLTSVTFPAHVTKIGKQAFSGIGLDAVLLPDSVTETGEDAFEGCQKVLYRGVTVTELWGVRVSDIVSFVVRRDFSARPERFGYAVEVMSPVKCDTLWKMLAAHPEDADLTAYIQQNLYAMIGFLIKWENAGMLEFALASGLFRLDGCIEDLLEYAHKSERYELWLMLLREKDERIGYKTLFSL